MFSRVIVKITAGPKAGADIEFNEHDTFIFGRERDCHICIPEDDYLSRHHFLLEINPPEVRIRDLGSLNGTYVNGKKIGGRLKEETPEQGAARIYPQIDLHDDDEIRTGDSCFIVKQDIWQPKKIEARCQKCGKDVTSEIGSDRPGDYICHECEGQLAINPQVFIQEIMKSLEGRSSVTNIPDYRILKSLGKGGMGEVFQVENKTNGQIAALKVMLSKIAVNPDARNNFLREIHTTSVLRHKNIINLINSGSVGSLFFIVMEFCEEGNLIDLISRLQRPLSLKETLPFLLQVLDGLAYAHSKGFVHRDIKPQNILLKKERGELIAKIGDFGLSKNFTQAGFSGMTITGNYAGSYPFMPREQLTNFKYVKPVSDVWSVAATFYFLLTGDLPRIIKPGEDPMIAILKGDILPIQKRRSDIPSKFAKIIDRALSNDPKSRYQSAEQFRSDILAS